MVKVFADWCDTLRTRQSVHAAVGLHEQRMFWLVRRKSAERKTRNQQVTTQQQETQGAFRRGELSITRITEGYSSQL